ncbi:MAG TPA: hypothetical protein VFK11_01715 [Candidatus Saccharimonadales bacterium]|nr:hypothetical protein [Candidatus Saccharimonadales bacterium]
MFWNLEIRAGEKGEQFKGKHERVTITPKRFYMHSQRGREYGFLAYSEDFDLIERISCSPEKDGEGLSFTNEGLVIKGLSVYSIPDGLQKPGSKIQTFAHAARDRHGELHFDWEGDIPELHRQWKLHQTEGGSLAVPATTELEAGEELERTMVEQPEPVVAGRGTA